MIRALAAIFALVIFAIACDSTPNEAPIIHPTSSALIESSPTPELDFEPTLDAPATDTRAPAATRTRIPTQTATRTATRTATHPPATSTRRPPAPITGSLPPATIVPLCGFDTQFVYGDEVPDEQRALISEAAETGLNSDCALTGVGADFGVYAFNDLNELLQIYSQLTHSPLQLVRQEWRGGGQPAITGPGGIYLNLPRISQNRRMLVQVITHEYFHVVQAKLTGPHFEEPGVPELGARWLIEGAAEYVSALGTEKAGLDSALSPPRQTMSGRRFIPSTR